MFLSIHQMEVSAACGGDGGKLFRNEKISNDKRKKQA
jgi:hypothetical protein